MSEYSALEKIRLAKIDALRKEGIEPFPTRAKRTHTSAQAVDAFEAAEKQAAPGQSPAEVQVTLAGRIRANLERYLPLPSPDELASLDLAAAEAVYHDRFGDAGDFIFVLVGDFDPMLAEFYAAAYLGTLDGGGTPEEYQGARPATPSEVVERTVAAGTGQRGAITLLFSTRQELTPEHRVDLDILEAVIAQRLVSHIREELSASYSPTITFQVVEEPQQGMEATIRVDCDPADLDDVTQAVLADLTDLLANGPLAR